jgi:hypothetical protein
VGNIFIIKGLCSIDLFTKGVSKLCGQMVPEMTVIFNQLAWLTAREDFIGKASDLTENICSPE